MGILNKANKNINIFRVAKAGFFDMKLSVNSILLFKPIINMDSLNFR